MPESDVSWSDNVSENAKALYRIQMDYYKTPSKDVIAMGVNNLWEWMERHGVRVTLG